MATGMPSKNFKFLFLNNGIDSVKYKSFGKVLNTLIKLVSYKLFDLTLIVLSSI